MKASIIDYNIKLRSNVLLIISTSLIVNNSRYKLKKNLISVMCCNKEKIIYINNTSSSRAFFKSIIDYILEIDYNVWAWDLAI